MGKTENGKRLRDSQWKRGVIWLKRRVKFFPAKNEQTSVKMSVKLHSEMSGEILASVGISQWILSCCWNRVISSSTFLIKCRHFQWALPCSVLQATSPVCLSWIRRCRAPGQPSCLDCVRERNLGASRLLSTNVGTRSLWGCWLLIRVRWHPTVAAPAMLTGLLWGTDTAWASLPRWPLPWHWFGLCRSAMIFFKTFKKLFSSSFFKLLIQVWEFPH